MRLHFAEEEMTEDDKELLGKIEVIVALLHHMKNSRGDVDHRGIAIAITHVETASLWIKDALKVVE